MESGFCDMIFYGKPKKIQLWFLCVCFIFYTISNIVEGFAYYVLATSQTKLWKRSYYHLTGICSKNWEGCNNYYWCKRKSNTSRNRKRMQATLAHFLHPYEFFARCILFKCHKCIAKSSIWQKYLKVKIINLNKNIY
jgi:hypothetical protein